MNLLLLKNFNNYFNRIVKRFDTLDEYKANAEKVFDFRFINFNPADGVTTTQVIGSINQQDNDKPLDWDVSGTPDYCIAYDDHNNIVSRWFIIESDRTRNGQYNLTLKRDSIADHLDEVLDATTFVEKGTASFDSVLAYNKENIEFNQIKQSETLLKDKSQTPWIIGYIAKNASDDSISVNYDPSDEDFITVAAADITAWPYYKYASEDFVSGISKSSIDLYWSWGKVASEHMKSTYDTKGGNKCTSITKFTEDALRAARNYTWNARFNISKKIANAIANIGYTQFDSAINQASGLATAAQTTELMSFMGKTIKTTDGKFYKIDIKNGRTSSRTINILNNANTTNLFSLLTNACIDANVFDSAYNLPDSNSFKLNVTTTSYRVIITEVSALNATIKISNTRLGTKDAVYDIIAMPLESVEVGTGNYYNFTKLFDTEKYTNINAMSAIARELSTACYDMQLLPYCPIQNQIIADGRIAIDTTLEHVAFDYLVQNETNIGIVFYVPEANFTFNIDEAIEIDRPTEFKKYEPIIAKNVAISSIVQTYPEVFITKINPANLASVGNDSSAYSSISYDDNGTTKYQYGNYLKIKKISKETGEVLASYMAGSIRWYRPTPIRETTSLITIYKLGSASDPTVRTAIETIYADELAAADWIISIEFGCDKVTWTGGDTWKWLLQVPVYDYVNSEIEDLKVENQCNMYRLTGPNYQSEFEFSVAKNGGVDYFNVDCTYKPYNPYIHLNPNFKNLYGRDFDDARGLILNGDFSFGMITDAFATYEMNNKNFREIFDRQIQNLDINNAINKQEAIAQTIVGTAQGVGTGAAAGAFVGGGIGAGIGGTLGGVASAAGGMADLVNLTKRQTEAKNYSVDMYSYNIKTIQARPYAISKCSALTYNNKLYPFVEKYSCTQEEKEIFLQKLKYDGMTIMTIGKIQDYTERDGRMLRGDIIRINLGDETHLVNDIYNEIKKGVYL